MCPYMGFDEKDIPQCKPKQEICTMCVMGNASTYKEIEKQEKEREKHADTANKKEVV